MAAASVRAYQPRDLDALYEICLRTGLAGEDASDVIEDPRLLGEIYVAPYAALEPELAFVVDDGSGAAVGYVLGALDTRAFEAACEREWWPALRLRYPERTGETATGAFDDLLVGLIHHRHHAADHVVSRYPSHLHIDLLPSVQQRGWGRRLLQRLLDELGARGSRGVHLGVAMDNERATAFYEHMGFVELERDPVTRTMGLAL